MGVPLIGTFLFIEYITLFLNLLKFLNPLADFIIVFILELLEGDTYKLYGYTLGEDMYKEHKNIYLSKEIDDYLVDSYDYSKDSVSYNSYNILYVLNSMKNKSMI